MGMDQGRLASNLTNKSDTVTFGSLGLTTASTRENPGSARPLAIPEPGL